MEFCPCDFDKDKNDTFLKDKTNKKDVDQKCKQVLTEQFIIPDNWHFYIISVKSVLNKKPLSFLKKFFSHNDSILITWRQ